MQCWFCAPQRCCSPCFAYFNGPFLLFQPITFAVMLLIKHLYFQNNSLARSPNKRCTLCQQPIFQVPLRYTLKTKKNSNGAQNLKGENDCKGKGRWGTPSTHRGDQMGSFCFCPHANTAPPLASSLLLCCPQSPISAVLPALHTPTASAAEQRAEQHAVVCCLWLLNCF